MPSRLGILIGPKGRGSNMQAIVEACSSGSLDAEVAIVLSPKDGTPAVQWAQDKNLNVAIVPPGEEEGLQMLAALSEIDVLCLAGFLRLLPAEILSKFNGSILNIHPALLPKFGGQGMYGIHVHKAVLAAKEKESGCSVHLVTQRYDEGAVLVQLRCPVESDDTPDTLAARVLALEHQAYPMAIRKVIGG